MEYDYSAIVDRGPLRWPDGARVALIPTINLETWDLVKDTDRPYYAGGPPILPDPLPGDTPDFPNYTWREYGQRVGVFRLFETFDAAGVVPSCTFNAVTAQRRRAMLDRMTRKRAVGVHHLVQRRGRRGGADHQRSKGQHGRSVSHRDLRRWVDRCVGRCVGR